MHMKSGFAECRLLAYARDFHKKRDVRIYLLPGMRESVGVSDGVEHWLAPVVPDLFSVDVPALMSDLTAGKRLPKPVPLDKARRLAFTDDNAKAADVKTAVISRRSF